MAVTAERLSIDAALDRAWKSLPESLSARLDAQLLLGHVLGRRREWLLAHGDEPVPMESHVRFERLIERRATGEPVAYLLGVAHWLDLQLEVTPGVLIPRPETETLFERAAALVEKPSGVFVDVGTGSGAIAIALARAFPEASVIAIDISDRALAVAARNVPRYGVGQSVRLVQGSLLDSLCEEPDLVIANLPYLSDAQMESLPRDVRFEPEDALHGGPEGLDLIKRLVEQLRAADWAPTLALEIDGAQGRKVSECIRAALPPGEIRIWPDLAGRDRVVTYR